MAQFEKNRQALIERNGGEPPTNEEFQAEQPAYYKWFFAKQAVQEIIERETGVKVGTIDAALMAARTPHIEGSKMQMEQFLLAEDGTIAFEKILENAFLENDNLISQEEADRLQVERVKRQALKEQQIKRKLANNKSPYFRGYLDGTAEN